MKQKMWDGRFEEGSSELLEEFNASIFFDKKLYKEDITGSLAHAKMLCAIGVLSKDELSSIQSGLAQVLAEIESGKFEFSAQLLKFYMYITVHFILIVYKLYPAFINQKRDINV